MALAWYDWVIFFGFLGSGLVVGAYVAWKNKNENTTDFMMAGKSLTWFPVAVSLFASFTSAITLISTPADIYQNNTDYFFIVVPWLLGAVIAAFTFFRLFYSLNLNSSYEYLERRFGTALVRRFVSGMFMLQSIITMGISLYAPSLSFSAANDGADVWIFVLAAGLISLIYTTLGGLKAVVWVDVSQAFVMFLVILIVLVKSWMDAGGFRAVVDFNVNASRLRWPSFELDPYDPNAFWNMMCYTLMILATFSVNQVAMQRCLSCKSLRHGQAGMISTWPINLIVIGVCCSIGLSLAVIYEGEDPKDAGHIDSYDQLVTYYVKSWEGWNGFIGLYSAALYSGAISTVSSSQAVLAQLTIDDFIRPFFDISDRKAVRLSRFLMIFYGALTILLAYVASKLGDLLRPTLSIMSTFSGPFLGLFMAALFPWATKNGCMVGSGLGFAIALWICIGSLSYSNDDGVMEGLDYVYGISYLLQAAMAAVVAFLLSIICSGIDQLLAKYYFKVTHFVPPHNTVIRCGCAKSSFDVLADMDDLINPDNISLSASSFRNYDPEKVMEAISRSSSVKLPRFDENLDDTIMERAESVNKYYNRPVRRRSSEVSETKSTAL